MRPCLGGIYVQVPAQAPKVIQMTPVEREEALKQAAHLDKLPQTLRDRVAVAQQLADRMSSAATVQTSSRPLPESVSPPCSLPLYSKSFLQTLLQGGALDT
jgi:hypothetical protein